MVKPFLLAIALFLPAWAQLEVRGFEATGGPRKVHYHFTLRNRGVQAGPIKVRVVSRAGGSDQPVELKSWTLDSVPAKANLTMVFEGYDPRAEHPPYVCQVQLEGPDDTLASWTFALPQPRSDTVALLRTRRPPARAVVPQRRHNPWSGGQASAAMCITALTTRRFSDLDVNQKYGFDLLQALNGECSGYTFKDGGELGPDKWALIDQKVNQEKIPVIVALNGPEFAPEQSGAILVIVKTEGHKVTFADPLTGTLRTTTKEAMNEAPKHPDDNFIFYGTRDD